MITIQNSNRVEIEIGGIALWNGAIATIPAGWHQCNGLDGTLDIEAIYVMGAIYSTSVGLTGGAVEHLHALNNTGSSGDHNHSFGFTSTTNGSSVAVASGTVGRSKVSHSHSASANTEAGGAHTHSVGNTDAASSHPPFHRLYWIMRIS